MTDNVDLYRQMLWGAQKVEDKELARILRNRLSSNLKAGRGICNKIIPFPVGPLLCTETEPAIFLREPPFWTGLMHPFMGLGIVGTWLFLALFYLPSNL